MASALNAKNSGSEESDEPFYFLLSCILNELYLVVACESGAAVQCANGSSLMPSPPPVIPPVDPVFILPPGGAYSDYRPVIDKDGQQVIFERTIAGIGTVLYRIANLSSPTPLNLNRCSRQPIRRAAPIGPGSPARSLSTPVPNRNPRA